MQSIMYRVVLLDCIYWGGSGDVEIGDSKQWRVLSRGTADSVVFDANLFSKLRGLKLLMLHLV